MIFNILNNDPNLDILLHGKKDGFYFEIKNADISLGEKDTINDIIVLLGESEIFILKNKEEDIEINLFIRNEIKYGKWAEFDYNDLTNSEKTTINNFVMILEKNKTDKL